jgi:hypothetical protein
MRNTFFSGLLQKYYIFIDEPRGVMQIIVQLLNLISDYRSYLLVELKM